ncbi:hypothetical protein M2459_002669 [Parabacteroides sp. PF5-5]|uniref:hypothetical protein n=1 Tax=unclassified Parabacteroides TaxID=2649774 RepID=UPI002475CC65|nr:MULTISPECIES: hypothetical protein [unclassified Parabacteroides]MDH6306306.1 hypothetical protein [Parabacteroides sp. PH5-39]MDH6316903.1 hypothetical protein [Parabacteroides sp. PF5-13]MDH6320972.1 hypothetical protein [Parabacteroides sp. PH5-13]MDH6324704.1 hypothetical protein [Parabacteroides sp. PH5-8]MDH6328088.1 hypothetical protein [Parabacteroides sp. PH5-41]
MKETNSKQRISAWVLILCLLPLTVAKLTHHHAPEDTGCCSSHHSTDETEQKHSADDCFICKFTLSPFLHIEIPDNPVIQPALPFEPAPYQSTHLLAVTHSYLLRAPPFLS